MHNIIYTVVFTVSLFVRIKKVKHSKCSDTVIPYCRGPVLRGKRIDSATVT